MRQRKGFQRLAQVLETLGKSYPGFSRRMKEIGALGYWDQAVGPAIARHSRALKIEDGVLWVEVDHPTWKAELHYRKHQIIEKLQEFEKNAGAPSIKDLLLIEPRKEVSARRPGPTQRVPPAPK